METASKPMLKPEREINILSGMLNFITSIGEIKQFLQQGLPVISVDANTLSIGCSLTSV
jgi:hypothetical protein